MEEQLEQVLESLAAENAELRASIVGLQAHIKRQRLEYLKERRWRIKFQMDFLQAEAAKTEAELREPGFGSPD